MSLEIIGVENFPIIEENDDLSRIICDTLNYNNIKLEDDDVLVLAETVVSKAEGNYVKIEDVVVSDKAKDISLKSEKDAKQCQIILDNTKKIIRCQTGLIITETPMVLSVLILELIIVTVEKVMLHPFQWMLIEVQDV